MSVSKQHFLQHEIKNNHLQNSNSLFEMMLLHRGRPVDARERRSRTDHECVSFTPVIQVVTQARYEQCKHLKMQLICVQVAETHKCFDAWKTIWTPFVLTLSSAQVRLCTKFAGTKFVDFEVLQHIYPNNKREHPSQLPSNEI